MCVLALGSGAVVSVQPAHAGVTAFVTPVSWAYTDSRTPTEPYLNTDADAPIGTWRDTAGKLHRSRSYFTYDLSAYRGRSILAATLVASETAVNDCSRPRAWELWSTKGITPSTSWVNPPRELAKIADIGGTTCPQSRIETDITDLIRQATAKKQATLTLELRVPKRAEFDLHFGRTIDHGLGISIHANSAPDAPANLSLADRSCDGPDPLSISSTQPTFKAWITDPDVNATGGGDLVTPTFAVWPTDSPGDRVEWNSSGLYAPYTAWGFVPGGVLRDGVSYVIAVRAIDGDDASSPWSECHFTVDTQGPEQAPIVVSTDYPEGNEWPGSGGPDIPGTFTFSANGATDVVGYRYSLLLSSTGWKYVAAASPGGPASVVIAPLYDGWDQLEVCSVDRAGNCSPVTTYEFVVRVAE